jgi:putative SOS response-associated peptidase YedK
MLRSARMENLSITRNSASPDSEPRFQASLSRSSQLFAFAGLWDRWRGPQGDVVESCSILTTTPNSLLADIHDRMPVILSPDNYDLWLDPAFRDTRSVWQMLKPLDPALRRRYPVSTRVNQVQNDDAECAKPLERESSPTQSMLF